MCKECCFKISFESFGIFITLKKYANAELDKTELPINFEKQNPINGNKILLRNTEY